MAKTTWKYLLLEPKLVVLTDLNEIKAGVVDISSESCPELEMFTQSQSNKRSASGDVPLKPAVLHYCLLICIHHRALNHMLGE